eukprot:Clim_evm29s99 gene=Clim_evmTU29s99
MVGTKAPEHRADWKHPNKDDVFIPESRSTSEGEDSDDCKHNIVITKSMLDEETKIHQDFEKTQEEDRIKAHESFESEVKSKRLQRLNFLLEKTDIYSSFLKSKMEQQREEKKLRKERESKKTIEAAKKTSVLDEQKEITTRTGTKRGTASPARPKAKAVRTAKRKATKDLEKKYDIEEALDQSQGTELSNGNDAGLSRNEDGIVQPALVSGGQLRDYQLEGVEWMIGLWENGLNGILGDEMGLGKTLQCISFIAHLVEHNVRGPYLIAAPLSTLGNWINEFRRFTPEIPVMLYHGSPEDRVKLRRKMGKLYEIKSLNGVHCYPIVVTSYEIVMRDRKFLQNHMWKYVIVDEGHRIKNLNCRLVRELKSYHSANRLLLTGTPLQNNIAELWSLLNFLLPDIFDDLDTFQQWFDFGELGEDTGNEERARILNQLHKIMSPFLLRRLKSDLDINIPKKKEYLLYAPMTEVQRTYYTSTLDRSITALLNMDGQAQHDEEELLTMDTRNRASKLRASSSGFKEQSDTQFFKDADGVTFDEMDEMEENRRRSSTSELAKNKDTSITNVKLQNVIQQLRRICCHPYLIDYPLTKDGDYRIDDDLVKVSGKLQLLDQILPRLHQEGRKVLLFSQFTTMLDVLQDYMWLRGYGFCRLDGSTGHEERLEAIDSFNNDKETFAFLLSTRAGGLGINLVAADTCIIYDSDWNPQVDLQAQDRCHRIGQKHNVIILRLCTEQSIEQKILERAGEKRQLEKLVIHQKKFKGIMKGSKALNADDLRALLGSEDAEKVNYKETTRRSARSRDSTPRSRTSTTVPKPGKVKPVLPQRELDRLLDRDFDKQDQESGEKFAVYNSEDLRERA